MNQLCALTCTVVRSYSRRIQRKLDTAGLRGKIELTKEVDGVSPFLDMEDDDFGDISQLESDFMDVHESHATHERQMKKAREKLQQDITAEKYFEVSDPTFLTLCDQDQIKKLHKKDPEEWTVERLSEKFPALPDTIAKVLKDKWRPTSTKRVLEYDKKVLGNWKKFQAGKLAVSDTLKSHLLTFGDRASRIDLKQSETIAKFLVAPKIEIPKPKHNLFVQLVSPAETEPKPELLLAKGESSQKESNSESPRIMKSNPRAPITERTERLTFTEFAEKKYEQIYEKSDKEAAVLLDAYVKQSEIVAKVNVKKHSVEASDETNEIVPIDEQKAQNYSLQTYVVKTETLEDTPTTYVYPIKIPQGAYKKGKTYRVHDCYYDDDGEFLYRIPGLKS